MGRFDVVISGGSFSGLALARALSMSSQGSLSIAVINRDGWPTPDDAAVGADSPRAFAMSAASKRLLDVLGAWSSLAELSQPVRDIDLTDSALDDAVRPVLMSYANHLETGEPASYIVPDGAVRAALLSTISGDDSITLIGPVEVDGYRADGNGAVLSLSDGTTLGASLVVAAEGRRSRLREAASIKLLAWDYKQTGIVTRVRHELAHEGRAVQHFLPNGPFAILPLPGNQSCITWSEERDEARRILALDDDAFLMEVDKRFGGKLGQLELVGSRQSWPLSMHLARRFVGPRLALIGDTAHGVHPLAGQGLNLGFRDVAALTEVLIENARLGLDVGDLAGLARYERWRRFDSTLSTAAFDGLNRLFSNDNVLVRAARDVGLGIVDRIPMLKERFVKEAAGLNGQVPKLLLGEMV